MDVTESNNNASYRATSGQLRQYVEGYEKLDIEKKEIADHQKDLMAEAKANGYDTAVLKKLIALRKRDKDDVAEEAAIMDMYKEALGMDV